MRLDELKDDNLAWDGLQADLSLQDIPGWLKRFVSSGLCGHRYQGDAFYASSNAMATWVDSLADLLQRKISETAKDNNAAAMREALEAALVILEERQKIALCRKGFVQIKTKYCDLKDAIEKCRSALSSPARNCDRFSGADEAKKEFNYLWNFVWKRGGGVSDGRSYRAAYDRWLFAPVAERKGEGDD